MNLLKTSHILLASFYLAACSPIVQMDKVDSFQSCTDAGNPVMESYPAKCSHEGTLYVQDIDLPAVVDNGMEEDVDAPVELEDEGRKPCTREFVPVCGEIEVQCVKAPCPPIKTTFSNKCEAENAGAKNLVDGACVDEAPNPEGACLSFDGTWLEASQECEGMGPEQCTNLGGTSNECASACRNNPDAELCTMQCVLVCQFN